MKSNAYILIPFDLGLELDFVGKDAKDVAKEVSSRPVADLTFQDRVFSNVKLTAEIYKFGVGLIQLAFPVEGELDFLAGLACQAETVSIGKAGIVSWAGSLVDGLINRARKFASYQYEKRLAEIDFFPVFVLEQTAAGRAEEFLRRHRKALYGIVSGEPNYETLSDFVLEQESLANFGYYQNEIVLIKRFGAVVSSQESRTILDMIRLAYAQHWSLRSYNYLLDLENDKAQSLLARLPPFYKVWVMPHRYHRFSEDAMGFARDKLAIVDSLYNVSANVPHIESDWHLRTLYKNVEKEFDIDDLAKSVDVKLERIEQAYNSVRDFLSTNFFIAVEIVLILSLAWMVLDTSLLFVIAQK